MAAFTASCAAEAAGPRHEVHAAQIAAEPAEERGGCAQPNFRFGTPPAPTGSRNPISTVGGRVRGF
ncbi:hypothetical protein PJI17_24540 [Mycobacterium kansasii]